MDHLARLAVVSGSPWGRSCRGRSRNDFCGGSVRRAIARCRQIPVVARITNFRPTAQLFR